MLSVVTCTLTSTTVAPYGKSQQRDIESQHDRTHLVDLVSIWNACTSSLNALPKTLPIRRLRYDVHVQLWSKLWWLLLPQLIKKLGVSTKSTWYARLNPTASFCVLSSWNLATIWRSYRLLYHTGYYISAFYLAWRFNTTSSSAHTERQR